MNQQVTPPASSSGADNSGLTATAGQESSSAPMVDIPLSLYWDEWSRCIGSRFQRDQLYRLGRLNSCSREWQDLKTAGRAKFLQYKDPEKCKKMMDSTFYKKRTTISPTAGAIWELKEKPGWD
mmetsp:Transcript_66954/g.187148  ORF Transcript_66954/g.187148 Transcript_66954/m.187148 type:complete len:123 (+) Transcript_66954:34-402(+)